VLWVIRVVKYGVIGIFGGIVGKKMCAAEEHGGFGRGLSLGC
jgi:hypothetical protein